MLMSLGLFVFSLDTAPFQTLKRSTAQRWARHDRTGKGPAYQYTGQGEDKISIDGTLAPDITGGTGNLDKLRKMAAKGKSWIMTAGTGEVMGSWFIENVDETRRHLYASGTPRLIEFSLSLVRDWDQNSDTLGNLMDSMP